MHKYSVGPRQTLKKETKRKERKEQENKSNKAKRCKTSKKNKRQIDFKSSFLMVQAHFKLSKSHRDRGGEREGKWEGGVVGAHDGQRPALSHEK